jgi:hypothetical protein
MILPYVSREVKALVWFWIIDETYWTNPLLKCVDKLGWSKTKCWSKMKSMVMLVDM